MSPYGESSLHRQMQAGDYAVIDAKPQFPLSAPNHNYFAQVSQTVLDFFDPIAKAKKLICESIAHHLKQV